ncbi:hypothetical protein SAMN05216588_12665 [Pseudomonas flavescens]|uniref:Uncharacterized protein n=1 Tax=Phytopseudomonas flavescens TaxID=29435 RepID=A0A1G8P0D5_9GAMM|nr:hypothetical protein [Pseudomonas flavescens]SDI85270.1 hypothetical protein SAMN05216588_12665 [Pseudomonas flavescens]
MKACELAGASPRRLLRASQPDALAMPPTGGFKRQAYLLPAWASLACAMLGVLLPATEFVLLAVWATARRWPRLHGRRGSLAVEPAH